MFVWFGGPYLQPAVLVVIADKEHTNVTYSQGLTRHDVWMGVSCAIPQRCQEPKYGVPTREV